MSDPFVGEVQIFGFGFAPRGWVQAAGQLVAIRQYGSLYALYGTLFGGDGVTTFGLPNLASRQACGAGQSPGNTARPLGSAFGTPSVTLTTAEMPAHTHTLSAYGTETPSQAVAIPTMTTAIGNDPQLSMNAIGMAGGGIPHTNIQPILGLNYSVALTGVYPYFS